MHREIIRYMSEIDAELEETPLVKRLRKEIADRDKALKARDEELEALRTKERTSTITSFLEGKGANPAISKFIGSDIEATPEALEKWYSENASLFGAPTSPTEENAGEEEPTEENPVDDETVEAIRAAQAAQAAGGRGPGNIGIDKALQELKALRGQGSDVVLDRMRELGLAAD